jgi:excisionase family DNA binding protein
MMYQEIKAGEIKTIKVGRRTLIPESELQKWLARKMQATA